MAVDETRLLLGDIMLPEGPRWHDGRLYFSDMFAAEVVAVDLHGVRETIARVPGRPSGLGWLPDGRLVVSSMLERKLYMQGPHGLVEAADLSSCCTDRCNDMVIDRLGRAYVGDYPVSSGSTAAERQKNAVPANLVLVDFSVDATHPPVRVVARDLFVPNGAVITPDGQTLIVAETARCRLTAFTIEADGSLSDRRVWAEVDCLPDGLALDAEGCIWMGSPYPPSGFMRVTPGGEVRERITLDGIAGFACALGGIDRKTLFLLEAPFPPLPDQRRGRIRTLQVASAGAGIP